MKEHFQDYGVRKWAGDDLIELQSEPLAALQTLVAPYAPCIVSGCEVTPVEPRGYAIAPGLVALPGKDAKGKACVKLARFAGVKSGNDVEPYYLTLTYQTATRTYMDGKSKAIAYDYTATPTRNRPEQDGTFLEIGADGDGGQRLVDRLGITQKLDQEGGDASAVKVTFNEAAARELPESGNRLGTIVGSVRRWFSDLRALAFKDKVALSDLDTDTAEALDRKVDKIKNKGLSTEDFTTELKEKLVNITVDTALNDSSENPVQNGVVSNEFKNYIPMTKIGNANGSIPTFTEFPSWQSLVRDKYIPAEATTYDIDEYLKGICRWLVINRHSPYYQTFIGTINCASLGTAHITLYGTAAGEPNGDNMPRYALGILSLYAGRVINFHVSEHVYHKEDCARLSEVENCAKLNSDNNLTSRGNEFNFANDTVGQIHVNHRRGTGQRIGGISSYLFEDGGGGCGLAEVTAKSFMDSSGYVYSPKNMPAMLGNFEDRRSVVEQPNDYNATFAAKGIKNVGTYNIPAEGGTTYAQVLGYRGWSDSSGGNAHEFALTGDNGGRMFHRTGATTEWGAWREVAHMDNLTECIRLVAQASWSGSASGSSRIKKGDCTLTRMSEGKFSLTINSAVQGIPVVHSSYRTSVPYRYAVTERSANPINSTVFYIEATDAAGNYYDAPFIISVLA